MEFPHCKIQGNTGIQSKGWAKIPAAYGEDDFAFISDVFAQTGVLLSPGSGFGEYGRGHCRTSLVIDEVGIERVLTLLQGADINWA